MAEHPYLRLHEDPLIVAICDVYESHMLGIPRAAGTGGELEYILNHLDVRSVMRDAMKLHEEREECRTVSRALEMRKREQRPLAPTLLDLVDSWRRPARE